MDEKRKVRWRSNPLQQEPVPNDTAALRKRQLELLEALRKRNDPTSMRLIQLLEQFLAEQADDKQDPEQQRNGEP